MSMFENFKNLAGLMGQAKEIRQKVERLQADLARQTVEADAGAGAVRVVANGKLQIVSVRLDRTLLLTLTSTENEPEEADQQMVEDLIAAATNAALSKARDLIQQEMRKLTGGLDLGSIPGLDKLLGGESGP